MKKARASILEDSFPHRLRRSREAKGLSQSDLARKIWGTDTDARGYTVARNRSRISSYEDGRTEPTRENLKLIAKALGMSEEQLAPELVSQNVDSGHQAVSMNMLHNQPDRVHLRVNVLTKLEIASKVIALLSSDQTIPVKTRGQ